MENYQEVPKSQLQTNQPKLPKVRKPRRRSGFDVFCDEFMKLTVERYPEVSDTERFKILAREWRQLSIEQKKCYNERAKPVNYLN